MKRICAWCTRDMGTVETSIHPDTVASHGICNECVDNLSFQTGVSCQDYIDRLPLPVLLLVVHAGSYLVTRYVNRNACALLQKEPAEMVQHLAGNVFECAHARLPEGCGRTVHCSGCTIRRAVMDAYRTGRAQSMVPATLKRSTSGKNEHVEMLVTTVKTGELIVLRIEELSAAPAM